MAYPIDRPRRLRRNETIRRLVRETRVGCDDLVLPLFVVPGSGVENPVASMPGVFQHSVDKVVEQAKRAHGAGLPAVLLFGVPARKDSEGSRGWDDDGEVQRAVSAIKTAVPDLLVITDVCLCEYTDHGHCGVLDGKDVDNDPTLERLRLTALSHARSGADIVAPSDMMDGRVGAIRRGLDEEDYASVAILSYAVKFCSVFYGPFRDAAESAPKFGDRRTYQMDPANADEALREAALDFEEGADIVMVKPALPYLDVVFRVKQRFQRPVAAYQVSGEYSMIKAAAGNGWIDESRAIDESLTAIKRAGADIIVSYFAFDVAERR
ncbi:MAG: porphobilinogen synthase [Myxococcales bacterium]|nr:MAG: porphobilinogen synthase [Myxococcales bacterium]